jgi:hypothetical protein
MKSPLQKIVSILVKWFQPKHKIVFKQDLPENLADKTIYLIGESTNPWLIAFKCPCGCNSVIQLNLLREASPRWRLYVKSKKKVDIFPSVWRTNGCKSHFFIRGSKVEWIGKRIRLSY